MKRRPTKSTPFKHTRRAALARATRSLKAALSSKRQLLAGLSCLALMVIVFGAWRVRESARRQLDEDRKNLGSQGEIPFEKKIRAPLRRGEVTFRQSTATVRAVARFGDSYFAATGGGLLEMSAEGNPLRHYTVLEGLPESDLTCLAVFKSKLYAGTRTKGLVAFDGERFESYRWTDRDAQAVNALVEDGGRLLVGTFAGGLIEFDGVRFRELKAGAEKQRVLQVTFVAKYGTRLYAGTFSDGLWVEEAGRWRHFTLADGLQSNRIVGVVEQGGAVFVASDFALTTTPRDGLLRESTQAGQTLFHSVATWPSLSGVARYGDNVLACLDDGELFAFSPASKPSGQARVSEVAWERPFGFAECRLAVVEDEVWLLGNRGIRRAARREGAHAEASLSRLSLRSFGEAEQTQAPSSNAVSALALDAGGRLWAGSFRDGLDVFAPDGKRLAHVESEAAREINALVPDADSSGMLVATTQGLLRFNQALRAEQLTTADGLLSNSVSHAAILRATRSNTDTNEAKNDARPNTLLLATSRGLSLFEHGRWRGLTTVQGLPSNSVYALFASERTVYAGTLGGLAEVEAGRVVRVFKDSNSSLTHNWVTGISGAGGRIFAGTYGGGVFELMPSGELHDFSTEIGKQFVNPNAMWGDGERLYVGTLDGAWVLDVRSRKWTHLKDELPSAVVLSITGDARHTYFGTTSGLARIETTFWNNPPKDVSNGR
ncbi:MAG: hypothetical protein LC754_05470 [Acidobacteria bacterium]|nr:hypothetical protein [Acidobacteriota bacterium]